MKSSNDQLRNRGLLTDDYDLDSSTLLFAGKVELLNSIEATDRTLAARLMQNKNEAEKSIPYLIEALKGEKKLYCKLEISKTLTLHSKFSVIPLIDALGEIGNNQHACIPDKTFKKNNYPLPRDIASRILAQIGAKVLPKLLESIEILNTKQLTEAIDAVGYICFYDYNSKAFITLYKLYQKHANNDLIKWKILRAMSAFPESIGLLHQEKKHLDSTRLNDEIDRSISLLRDRK